MQLSARWALVKDLFAFSSCNLPSPKSSLCAGGTHLTVLAQGLATYLTVGLHPKDLEKIAVHIYEETNKWLLFLFQ